MERATAKRKKGLAAPAIRAFLRLRGVWELTDKEALVLLGDVSRTTLHNWKKSPPETISGDTLERISYLLGIYKGLRILFPPQSPLADNWVKTPNRAFGGQSPLDRMLAGNVSDLHAVRSYVDHARGGDFV